MWLLQRKNLHKKHLLWLKIVGLCFGLHLIVLFWVFCIYRENNYMHCFAVNKKMDYSIPIVFSPQLHYIAPGTPYKTETKPSLPYKSAAIKPARTKAAPEKPKTVAIPAQKVETKKQDDRKKTESIETIKPVTPEKPVVKEKEITAEKKIEKKEMVPAPEKQEPTLKKEILPAQTPINAHVSNNYREVEAMRRGAQLQKELVQQWHPPVGVSPDCTCDISFFVDKCGAIQNLKMVKSSGTMMFDISARQALFAMKMPQWTYGKPLIISFKQ